MLGFLANSQAPLSTANVFDFVDAQAHADATASLTLVALATFAPSIQFDGVATNSADADRVRTASIDVSGTSGESADGAITAVTGGSLSGDSGSSIEGAVTAQPTVGGSELTQVYLTANVTASANLNDSSAQVTASAEAREKWEPLARESETWTEI